MAFIDKSQKNYDINHVCLLYFSDVNEKLIGCYPGPINNFILLSFSDIWYDSDPNLKEFNLPIKKNLKEKNDFIILDKENYHMLRDIFNCYYDIPRKAIKSNEEIIVEVYFFKVLIILKISLKY